MRWESSFTTKASSHYTPRSLSIHSGLLSSYASFLCLNVTSYPDGTPNQWYFLDEYGIVVEPLRCKLLGDCSLTGGAQAIVDLLDHFDFAKKITSVLIEVEHHPGQKYFIPCMLKNMSNNMQVRRKGHLQGALKKAATLHIMFSTNHVSPGFFVHLAACLTENTLF